MIDSYIENGFSLIPIRPGDKRPTGQWADAQANRAHPQQVEAWLEEELNLAVVTGSLSGVVVVDCDSEAGVVAANRLGMPVTPTATTGKGRHFFFAHPGRPVRNAVRLAQDVDIRGDGGYVLVAPSVHPNGESYRWVDGLSLAEVPLARCPEWVTAATDRPEGGRSSSNWHALFQQQVGKGERNQRCAVLSGYLIGKGVDIGVAHEVMAWWSRACCTPPMRAVEVIRTVDSIWDLEQKRVRL